MFGGALLISPVTTEGAKERSLYLPAGHEWIDFWTGKRLPGGQNISASAPLDTMPIFAKAGSIIPFGPPSIPPRANQIPLNSASTGEQIQISHSTRTKAIPTTTKREPTQRFPSTGITRSARLVSASDLEASKEWSNTGRSTLWLSARDTEPASGLARIRTQQLCMMANLFRRAFSESSPRSSRPDFSLLQEGSDEGDGWCN